MAENEFRHIVRVAQTDLDGAKHVLHALTKIKGVGVMFSNMACTIAKVNKFKKAGYLSEKEVKMLEEVILNPQRYGSPEWLMNRRRDPETGEDLHLTRADLELAVDSDIKRLKKTKSYKGLRHQWGLPVRGQKTKSNFRKNKGKVMGVRKKAAKKGGGSKKK
jgi:small subunit ribosomal protein S13